MKTRIANKQILSLEELSLNSWPALRSFHFDGWIVRWADGFTDRCNSVWPLYGSNLDQNQKIDCCQSFYRARGQSAIFRIPSDESQSPLDHLLENRGYTLRTPTLVQTLDISNRALPQILPEVTVTSTLNESWSQEVAGLIGYGTTRAIYHKILQKIIWPIGFASIRLDGVLAALGLGVLERPHIGIYGMYTQPAYRHRGWGRKILESLLQWAKNLGATSAYLHVEEDNTPAKSLYYKLGFTDIYSYWYRIRSQ